MREIINQCDTKIDFIINVGHNDLYFMSSGLYNCPMIFASCKFFTEKHLFYWQSVFQVSYAVLPQLL